MQQSRATAKTRARYPTTYSHEDKVKAVAAMFAANPEHPMSAASIEAAKAVLGAKVNKTTLYRWSIELESTMQQNHPSLQITQTDQQLILDTTKDVVADFVEIRSKMVNRLKQDDVVEKMSGRDVGVVMGITNDHIIKMKSLPPEIDQAVRELSTECQVDGLDTLSLIRSATAALRQRREAKHQAALDRLLSDNPTISSPPIDGTN